FLHMEIHLFVHQPKSNRLVPYNRLVMRLCISNGFFFIPPINHHIPHFVDIPIFIRFFFQVSYPKIRNAHSQSEIKPNSTFQWWTAQAWHTAHIFCNSKSIRVQFLHQSRSQLKINNSLLVHAIIKIFVVMIKSSIAMVVVEHGGYAIKTETVEPELLHPIPYVGQQKLLYFLFTIVEQHRIPIRVIPFCTVMEILVLCAIKKVEAFRNVFDSMGMHDVHDDGYA